ncbi:hypothetical protein K474DRAFT_119925 [Panus rudis PR-1116 ss-1]|nr:hypothetical protein K474DRAFT_119925 [Panus rudis PR-1116 ss-1]
MTSPLKGRKKFKADLASSMEQFERVAIDNCSISIDIVTEDDSILCEVSDPGFRTLAQLSFVISDTSEYPNHHTFYCFSQDPDPPAYVLQITESVSDRGSILISELLEYVLERFSKKAPRQRDIKILNGELDVHAESEQEGEDEDEDELYEMFDDYQDLSRNKGLSAVDVSALQRDFNEVVAHSYRPGIIRLGLDEIVLSVSIPVVSLAKGISPRALMAWDSRLLSENHHLTLVVSGMRDSYPALQSDGTLIPSLSARGVGNLRFRVGLTPRYKPTKELTKELVRNFALKAKDTTEESSMPQPSYDDAPAWERAEQEARLLEEAEKLDEQNLSESESAKFIFSLSTSLESLLQDRFLSALQLRLQYGLGWAAAELLISQALQRQKRPEDIVREIRPELTKADKEERNLATSYHLPVDPVREREVADHLNLPLLAFSYLIRRLTLCSRYCLVCYNRLDTDFDALKPYVCDSKLCSYQYYSHNRGPSLEYEIVARPSTVDLLVSLTYVAASEAKAMDPLPLGLGLQVPAPSNSSGALVEFDKLAVADTRKVIVQLLDSLPTVREMRRYLLKKRRNGHPKPRLQDMDQTSLPAAWLLLRWCVASCTAHLEELSDEKDRVKNIGPTWRQFRFSVGSPDAEEKFYNAQRKAQAKDANAAKYPSLYAFHGSAASNWHSIIRHGLWYKTIAHGRAYGDGVYFAKQGETSMQGYSGKTSCRWRSTELGVGACVTLAEIVNLPAEFTSQAPYFVVPKTEWIVCRYLLVNVDPTTTDVTSAAVEDRMDVDMEDDEVIPCVPLDPKHPVTLKQKPIAIPEPSYKLQKLLIARQNEHVEDEPDEDDTRVFNGQELLPSDSSDSTLVGGTPDFRSKAGSVDNPIIVDDDDEEDDWQHDPEWVQGALQHMLPPPNDASHMATMAVQRELMAMLNEQKRAKSLKQLGWYMPEDVISDNLFQWIVELHSFEEELPIAKDMQNNNVNSLVFEIRFPPTYPHSPPFFRILKPRFLPFIQGGGGHVTGGGSMCMDLLTSDGWLPSYSIPAILLQIRLAISNLDPRPARLASNWQQPYSMAEAVAGFRRAAATHGWRVPPELNTLAALG